MFAIVATRRLELPIQPSCGLVLCLTSDTNDHRLNWLCAVRSYYSVVAQEYVLQSWNEELAETFSMGCRFTDDEAYEFAANENEDGISDPLDFTDWYVTEDEYARYGWKLLGVRELDDDDVLQPFKRFPLELD